MPNMFFFTLTIFILVLAVLAVLRHKIYYHFKIVEPDKLYRSGRLSRVGLHLVCRKYNIKTIISLIPPKQSAEQDYCKMEERFSRQHNIKLINIPMIVDNPPEPEKVRQFLRISMNPDFQPVLVHCEGGIIRTNMMIAAYLKNRFDKPNQVIFENLPFFGHGLDKRPAVRDFIINYQKESWDIASEQAGKVKTQAKVESCDTDNPMMPKDDFELSSLIVPGKNDA